MARKQSILIIDDDSATLDLIRDYLIENGYDVTAHNNPVLAVKAIRDHDFDLVISDVKMNELSGDDILNYVLENKPGTGVFLMTGFGNINHCINAMKKGASDYITKPFDPDELLDRVEEFLSQAAHTVSLPGTSTDTGHEMDGSGNPLTATPNKNLNTDGSSLVDTGLVDDHSALASIENQKFSAGRVQVALPEAGSGVYGRFDADTASGGISAVESFSGSDGVSIVVSEATPTAETSVAASYGTDVPLATTSPERLNSNSPKITDIRQFFVGDHPKVRRLLAMMDRIANNNAPVFIHGESGTGKEVFANLIHRSSQRRDKPYIKINCANLPSELVESTLFGHIKGSFTGAISDKKGAFEEAEGGTLLLDEVTEINITVQAKLLRVLQEREFYRVGSQKPLRADVRIIATSNRNLNKAVNDGHFRQDLFYRLNVFPIALPPLRDRREDILLLAEHFMSRFCHQYEIPRKTIGSEMKKYLASMDWKGNVRELENLIHRGVVMAHGEPELRVEHVLDAIFEDSAGPFSAEDITDLPLLPIEEMELQMIRKALEKTNGNQKEAALLLEISDRTIRNKLRKINIS